MKIRIYILCGFLFLGTACSSNPHFMNPGVLSALEASGYAKKMKEIKSFTCWHTNYGHGLCIDVLEKLSSDMYKYPQI